MDQKAQPSSLSIFIADDHAIVRRGLRALLDGHNGWHICGEAANGRDAVQEVARLKPDVTILDISMPDLTGLEAAAQIHKAAPETKVLILTMYLTEEFIESAVKVGAHGYILKSDAEHDLIAAIKALVDDKTFFSNTARKVLAEGHRETTPQMRGETKRRSLTRREREVVQLIAEGRTNKELAGELGISPRTVENHRARIMQKLHLHSLSELVRYAIRNKILEA